MDAYSAVIAVVSVVAHMWTYSPIILAGYRFRAWRKSSDLVDLGVLVVAYHVWILVVVAILALATALSAYVMPHAEVMFGRPPYWSGATIEFFLSYADIACLAAFPVAWLIWIARGHSLRELSVACTPPAWACCAMWLGQVMLTVATFGFIRLLPTDFAADARSEILLFVNLPAAFLGLARSTPERQLLMTPVFVLMNFVLLRLILRWQVRQAEALRPD